jgi:hypothetical protein
MTHELTVPGNDLRPGDQIITRRDSKGRPTGTLTVNRLESGESCKGLHVNVVRHDRDHWRIVKCDGCYDKGGNVEILRDGT